MKLCVSASFLPLLSLVTCSLPICEQLYDDAWACMEKIETTEQVKIWTKLTGWAEDRPIDDPPHMKEWTGLRLREHHCLEVGAGDAAFRTINAVAKTWNTPKPAEVWMAFIWAHMEPPSSSLTEEDIWKIEMSMSVSVGTLRLYTWHMGITRNYWTKFIPADRFKPHKNISVYLHAYAAKVMLNLYPSLLYVRSLLADKMAEILESKLQTYVGSRVFFDDNIPEKRYRGGRVTLDDLNGNIVFDGSWAEYDWPRFDGGLAPRPFAADIRLLAEQFQALN